MSEQVWSGFGEATRAWFQAAFAEPTPAQLGAWREIAAGRNALVVAPTGSGKTLSAFLWSLDRLAQAPTPPPKERCRVLYVSPLKALAVDVERNLRAPLTGIRHTAARLGQPEPDIRVGTRSGDTPANERRALVSKPPDILITTPESLFLMLTSQAREVLRSVDTVIVDEVHAVAGTKRGAHLALSLERLDALLDRPAQRIGLSATVRPLDEVARFLGGSRPVEIVAPAAEKRWDLSVVVPVEDMAELGAPAPEQEGPAAGEERRTSIWPSIEERVVDLVEQHRSTIVFANSRRLAERLTARLNEIATDRADGHDGHDGRDGAPPRSEPDVSPGADGDPEATVDGTGPLGATEERRGRLGASGPPSDAGGTSSSPDPRRRPPAEIMAQSGQSDGAPVVIARAHHGSVSKDQRAIIEDDLKRGRLPCVVATSSLELGIDMGAVDLVIQIESPPSVASALQRVGRAGHQVGEVSRGVLLPKHRADLVHTAVAVESMRAGRIEAIRVPANPLDVLAQQVVAMTSMEDWKVDELYDVVRRAASYASLPRAAYEATLDLLSGRYPSDEFAELRPRIVWDRVAETVTGRPGAQRLAVTSGGTIPDRGLFGVFLVGEKASRVGELDEEMVYESRVGDVFALGATSWRIEDITHDRVLVSPAPGQPGRLPFWKGDQLGRPAELGEAIGVFTRELGALDRDDAVERCQQAGLDEWAAENLVSFVDEQRQATTVLPSDRTLLVERFRDELGDWRLVLHSPYGAQVHAPWALAIGLRLAERYGVDAQALPSDDGIVLRIPETDQDPPGSEIVVFDPDEIEDLVTGEVGGSALFASRFRECAARALLLPRRDPGRRSPLWQQRQRSAQLLSVASNYPSFPIVLEAVRECLQDVYDVPALVGLMKRLSSRSVSVSEVHTDQPSPFARSLLFGYVAAFMYEGDNPLAERRAAALSLDQGLLAELLGRAELRELLDPAVLAGVEAELQRLDPERKARDLEGVADLVRLIGPLSTEEVTARVRDDVAEEAEGWLIALAEARRVVQVRVAGESRWAAVEDVPRLRDGLGVPVPPGTPDAFLDEVIDPLADLVGRFARSHGPFTVSDVAERWGLGAAVVRQTLLRLAGTGRVVEGEFRPTGTGPEWCDAEVLRRLRRRSLAALRKEVEPVEPATLGRFLPAWQHVIIDQPAQQPTSGHGSRRPRPRRSGLSGVDGVLTVVEQLAGCAVPASALETLVLPGRVEDYTGAYLDELTATGEVVWAGQGTLPGKDGWVSLHLADSAPLTLPDPTAYDETPLHRAILDALEGGGAYFFRQLSNAAGSQDDTAMMQALWDLVWAGRMTNDTLAPLRMLGSSGGTAHRGPRRPARPRRSGRPGRPRPDLPARSGPPTAAGRWSLLPEIETDATRRSHASAEALLERHGVVTRGAVVSERVPGGFAGVYKVLSAFEDSGRCRRGYFVAGLGAAQFGGPGSVDRLRTYSRELGAEGDPQAARPAVVLAATDPANPYGAALPWPERSTDATAGETEAGTGHRPGRKAGALVILVDGSLTVYLERGGRTLLTFTDDRDDLTAATTALAGAVRRGAMGRLTVERADGEPILGSTEPLREALAEAGFVATPRGLRIRA